MRPRTQLRLNIAAVALYLALGTMFSSTQRYIVEELGGSKALAGFGVSIFFVAAVLTRPVVGRLADRHGRRLFLVVPPLAIAVLLVAMLGARSIPLVLVLRFAQGVFGSAFYTAAVTASTDVSAGRQASAVASLSIAIYIGFAAGPALGEVLLDAGTTWAWTVPAALAALAGAVTWAMPETRPSPAGHSRPAPVVGEDGWELVAQSAPGVTGAAPVPASVPATPAPATARPGPLRGFLHPAAIRPGITLLTLGVGYASVTALSAIYARSIGMADSAALYATFALTILVVRLVSGRAADAYGPVRIMYPGIACFVVGFGLLSLGATGAAAPLAVGGVALVGTGWALVFPALVAWLATHVPDAERGAALGSLIAFMDIGQGGGGLLVGALADAFGFAWAYLVPAAGAAAGGVVLAGAVAARGRAAGGA